MDLAYQYIKCEAFQKKPRPAFVILHGMMGSARNWISMGHMLAAYSDVWLLDLRNHGDSQHDPSMHFSAMSKDIQAFFIQHKIPQAYIIGHSLGGKVAMRFACDHQEWIQKLIVVDIVPKNYQPTYENELKLLVEMPLSMIQTRGQADAYLQPYIPNSLFRQFLLSNLARSSNQSFYWKPNIQVLLKSMKEICKNPLEKIDVFSKDTLFIKGLKSNFITTEDMDCIQSYFKKYTLKIIEQAGHNVHVEDSMAFLECVKQFCELE